MTEPEDNTPAAEPAIHSPGQQLRQAREAHGLSAQDAADKLHLHQGIITALETDEFDRLPSPIYARGYLRNYARLLGLDPEKIVAAYDGSDSDYPELKPPLTAPTQASSSDKPVRAVTYLVSLVLVLLLLAWWQSRNVSDDSFINLENLEVNSTPATTPAAEDNGSEETETSGLGYPIRVVRHPESPLYPRPDAAAPTAPTTEATTDTATTPAPLLEEMPTGDDMAPTQSTAQPTETDNATATATADTAADTTSTTPDDGGLKLDLNQESWIEVYDADGESLYMGLGKPGDTITVDGKAPLRVLLGFAPGVEVSYDGEAVDTIEHSNAGVAQFNVGE